MAIGRVLNRGQVTLPSEVRRKAEIKPGDVVDIEVIGKGEVRITALPNFSPRQLRELYPIDSVIDEITDRPAWEDVAELSLQGATVTSPLPTHAAPAPS